MSPLERVAVVGAALYLIVLGVAMQRLAYDLWGALVILPVLVAVSVPLIRRAFAGPLTAIRPYAWLGLVMKFAGAGAGYEVRFEMYGGAADAGRYHDVGRSLAGAVRGGTASLWTVVPTGTGTRFLEQFTGLVYTVVGSSRLAGFLVFAWMSYWGLVFLVKAAVVAVPGLAARRYALLVFLLPSIVYWGSSIGKEAFAGLWLGVVSYGLALIVARPERLWTGLVLVAAGLVAVARVRPHFAAIWAGALVIALVSRMVREVVVPGGARRRLQWSAIVPAAVATVGLAMVVAFTVNVLDPVSAQEAPGPLADRISGILASVSGTTDEGGSTFTPIDTSSPAVWPFAAARTLTRPVLLEARGLAGLLPALEMTCLLTTALVGWRRTLNVPRLVVTTPYLVFAAVVVLTFGVTFANVGNLGILVRQRSLVLPLLVLLWAVPPLTGRSGSGHGRRPASTRPSWVVATDEATV
ncbi:MAG TPA: hypothetical protein VIS05_11170 [Ilumatobacter sp.]